MGDVCAKADEVLACVGPPADDSEFFVKDVREIMEDLKTDEPLPAVHGGAPLLTNGNRTVSYTVRRRKLLRYGNQAWRSLELNERLQRALRAFERRAYWGRLWVVQEMYQAKKLTFHCGTDQLFPKEVHFISGDLHTIGFQQSLKSTRTHRMESLLRSGRYETKCSRTEPSLDPDFAFESFADLGCSNFRDHVYALLRMIRWSSGPEPVGF